MLTIYRGFIYQTLRIRISIFFGGRIREKIHKTWKKFSKKSYERAFQEFSDDDVTQLPLGGSRKFAKLRRTKFEGVLS